MTRVHKSPRLDLYDRYAVGFLDTYFRRVIEPRGTHDRYLAASATYPGLVDVSVFIETPWLSPRYITDRKFWSLVVDYLDDQLPAIIPSIVYFQLGDHIQWVDICDQPDAPRTRERAVALAIEEATRIVGMPPIEVWKAPA
jgi:hypothetical protein